MATGDITAISIARTCLAVPCGDLAGEQVVIETVRFIGGTHGDYPEYETLAWLEDFGGELCDRGAKDLSAALATHARLVRQYATPDRLDSSAILSRL